MILFPSDTEIFLFIQCFNANQLHQNTERIINQKCHVIEEMYNKMTVLHVCKESSRFCWPSTLNGELWSLTTEPPDWRQRPSGNDMLCVATLIQSDILWCHLHPAFAMSRQVWCRQQIHMEHCCNILQVQVKHTLWSIKNRATFIFWIAPCSIGRF